MTSAVLLLIGGTLLWSYGLFLTWRAYFLLPRPQEAYETPTQTLVITEFRGYRSIWGGIVVTLIGMALDGTVYFTTLWP